MRYGRFRAVFAAAVFAAAVCAATLFAAGVGASLAIAADGPDVKQLLVKYRKAALDAARRVAVVRELTAAGPDGTKAIQELLEKDLARLEASVPAPPKLDALDEKIAALRKKLAELRSEPELTKEKLQTEGLPALDELTAVWRQREMTVSQHFQRIAKTAAAVMRQREFFEKLREDRQGESDGPLPVADWLERAEKLAEKVSPPVDPVVREVAQENAKIGPKLPADVVSGMTAVNAMRIMCGLRPLVYDVKLCTAATGHSTDMQNENFFAHESPVPGKKTFTDRAALAETTASGENIYMGSTNPTEAIKAWFLSPGHHKNMLGEGHKRQGLGRAGKHWTQMFGA